MISPHCFELPWIEARRTEIGANDPGILEKAIHAFHLLSQLVRTDCDLVFKGGTSLLLHLPEFRRLSIDIDIVCSEPKAEFERRLGAVLENGPFTRWEPHIRAGQGLPKRRHYKFFYHSPTAKREAAVLLDVVEEPNVISALITRPIVARFFESDNPLTVRLPSIDALLADKLTAYAPRTIGVPLTERFSQQVVKQLFDVGQLYDHASDLRVVRDVNRAIFEAEASYRSSFSGTYDDYLEDVLSTSMHVACLQTQTPAWANQNQLVLLRAGTKQLANHLVATRFLSREAGIAAAQAAVLASVLGKSREAVPPELPRYEITELQKLRSEDLTGQLEPIRFVKKQNPEAFFFWRNIQR